MFVWRQHLSAVWCWMFLPSVPRGIRLTSVSSLTPKVSCSLSVLLVLLSYLPSPPFSLFPSYICVLNVKKRFHRGLTVSYIDFYRSFFLFPLCSIVFKILMRATSMSRATRSSANLYHLVCMYICICLYVCNYVSKYE